MVCNYSQQYYNMYCWPDRLSSWILEEEDCLTYNGEEMDIEIKKLNPDLISDYVDFFDNRAFSDHIEWSACYCVFFHWNEAYDKSLKAPGVDMHEHNRNLAVELIKKGVLKGYLAYENDLVIGWLNTNDKSMYETLNKVNRPDIWEEGDKGLKIKSITCFTVAPDYRRKGIASALLERALNDATSEGYDFAESYVRAIENPERNYHGHETFYLKAGFETYKTLENEKIQRKKLKG